MDIQAVTRFIYNGREFNSLKDIQDHLHNTIGEEVIDKIVRKCEIRHKDLFKLLDILCQPDVRKTLTKCLNVTYEGYEEDFSDEKRTINILDLKK